MLDNLDNELKSTITSEKLTCLKKYTSMFNTV